MHRALLAGVAVLCALAAAPALAGPKTDDNNGPWTVKIPHAYRHQGYSLRINDQLVPLKGEEVTLAGHDYKERIDLLDADGRLESSDKKYVDPYVFDFVHTREWRINWFFGSTQMDGHARHKLFQDGNVEEGTVDVDWQPHAYGLRLGYAGQTSDQTHDLTGGSLDSSYDSYQTRFAGTYETAPLAAQGGVIGRLHLLGFLGGFLAHHDVVVTDGAVRIDSRCDTYGTLGGLDLNLALTAWFWVGVRGYVSYQPVNFTALHDKQELVEHGALGELRMRFEIMMVLLFAYLAVTACSSPSSNPGATPYTIGRPVPTFSAPYLWGGASSSNQVVALDAKSHTLQEFNLAPFAHQSSLPLPLPSAQPGVVASADGGYFVITSDLDFAIMKPDGSSVIDPLEVTDGVASVAYAPQVGMLVLADDFHSMALMQLTPTGDVQASLRKGSLLPDGENVLTGAMMEDGRLVLFLDNNEMAVVQTAATIAAGDWQLTTSTIADSQGIAWAAAVPGVKDTVLAMDGSHLFSLNVATGTVTDSLDLGPATVLGQFRDYAPHVIVKDPTEGDAGVGQVYNVGPDGKIAKHTVRGAAQVITQTLYDPITDQLTVVYSTSLYRFRLSDNLAMDVSAVEPNADLILTPNYLVSLFPSTLGEAERRTYGSHPQTVQLSGYNLDSLAQSYTE